ncbi:MAG: DUF222 domain-containing protein, partial [Sandaracinaceae bacterium]|nr:DUF222 domain-containing protein [Sandaracinaceae bacterium]
MPSLSLSPPSTMTMPPIALETDALDPDAIEAELATLSAHLDAATHRQLTLIRLVDELGLWHAQGARSTCMWLSWRIGLAPGAARERLRIAKALASLPAIDEAFSKGQLSYSKVRAMTRVATPENESRLLDMALHSTAAQLEKMCKSARSVERLEGRASRDEAEERWVRHRVMDEGVVRIEAQLSADEAELVLEALRVVRESMRGGEAQPDLADALVRMAELTLASPEACEAEGDAQERAPDDTARRSKPTRTGADRAQVIVHLAPDVLEEGSIAGTLDDGTRVSAETLRRVACDCGLLGVREDERGHVLDIGRKTRSIPPALRRAVSLRDRGCRFPGCTCDRFIECHHVEHWLEGGETKLDNLLSLCPFHHRLIHEGGWTLSFDGDEPTFRAPDRKPISAYVSAVRREERKVTSEGSAASP